MRVSAKQGRKTKKNEGGCCTKTNHTETAVQILSVKATCLHNTETSCLYDVNTNIELKKMFAGMQQWSGDIHTPMMQYKMAKCLDSHNVNKM